MQLRTLPLILAACTFLAPAGFAQEPHKMLDTVFPAEGKASLKMQIRDGDVQVISGSEEEIRVQVVVEAKKENRARKYFETQKWDLSVRDEVVHITSRTGYGRRFRAFRFRSDPTIRIVVHTPRSLNVDIRTYDGDIAVNSIRGDLQLQTSDGDITGRELKGATLNARTYDGNITLDSAEFKNMVARTSEGNIALSNGTADGVEVRTYDGDIAFENMNGDLVLRTSDGDITATGLSGSKFEAITYEGDIDLGSADAKNLVARTSDGHIIVDALASESSNIFTLDGYIRVDLVQLGDIKLRASDGDIIVTMPAERAASLNLRGNRIQLACCPSPFFEGHWEKRRIEGRLNGGGALLQANAADGTVLVR